ncbi:hypothetical protein ACFU5O_11060 [Streptomyces sp. NPDC057445]|uniref:hypothetical protein n=1 Tax=Streptomyces sp. NPDC057445 TaxID=3346136 RepID=UPI0036750068
MGDVLLALCIPLTVCAGGIYAVCESWWRRGRPATPPPYSHAAARLAEREMLVAAEEVVAEAYARLAAFYEEAAHGHVHGDGDVHAQVHGSLGDNRRREVPGHV